MPESGLLPRENGHGKSESGQLLNVVNQPIPRLSQAGWLRAAKAGRSVQIRTVPINKRCASRASIRSALRADFEQTAPAAPAGQPPRLTQAGNGAADLNSCALYASRQLDSEQ